MINQVNLLNQSCCEQLASKLASCLTIPLILTFSGEIGAGKTTFIRAMLRTLGITGAIKSPTYSIVESYTYSHWLIHHFDFYRIHDEAELDYIGFRDFFSHNALCCIEWPEQANNRLDRVDINFSLTIEGSGRLITMQALSEAGMAVLTCLAAQ